MATKQSSSMFFFDLGDHAVVADAGFWRPSNSPSENVGPEYLSTGKLRQTQFCTRVLAVLLLIGGFLACNSIAAHAAPDTKPAGTTVAPSRTLVAVEREFLAAHSAFERRDVAALGLAREKFSSNKLPHKDFVLTPYITWWWFSAQLAHSAQSVVALGSEIEKFLTEFPDAPFSEQLQRDYLRALGKLNLWQPFSANQASYRGDDSEVACQQLRYRLLGDDRAVVPTALADAKALWIAAKPAAEPCYDVFERVFDQLRAAKMLGDSDVWQRTRTLFENGQMNDARRSAVFATNATAHFEMASAQVNLDAKRFLNKHVVKVTDRASVELALFAITRLARSNADSAAQWLDKNEVRFSATDAQYAWAQIGFLGAMQQDPNALDWFQRAGSFHLSDTQAAWLTRAALRETATNPEKWATIKRTISTMSESEKRDPAWRYWLARALAKSTDANDLLAVRTLRESLARENNFYGLLAAEELGAVSVPNFQGIKPTEASIAEVSERKGIKRALLLYKLSEFKADLRSDGMREWQFAIRGMDDQTLLAASAVAQRADLPDRAINTAERTQMSHDFGQRYPLPHLDPLQTSARQNGLDEAWLFGLIRQESRFITDARSRAGAQGLMQLMPATAKWVAKQIGLKNISMRKVLEVPTNLALGSFYLRHILDDLGHPVLATAGYNAGPGRARRWRADTPLEGAIYAESIPFNETRDYVKKVMVNQWYYSHRIYGKSLKLSEIMGAVPGKQPANVTILPGATFATTSSGGLTALSHGTSMVSTTPTAMPAPAPAATKTNKP